MEFLGITSAVAQPGMSNSVFSNGTSNGVWELIWTLLVLLLQLVTAHLNKKSTTQQ